MKRFFKLLTLSSFSFLLMACAADQTKTDSKESKAEHQVQLIVKEDTNTIDEKVSFKEGETVMDVLKANYKVKEKDGFITEIDGHKQDPKEQKYWLFKVNDKMAAKAANQLKVKKNDKIEFYIEKMK
ncbi:DUF4430 domain-containing protein [Streptococcus iniae]|uniref:DUF4430 domain-containing protein n=1 Tax=Streptococcus iniae TaxID=1346 RepID=A0A1J0MZS8_STRIN|nr:DUF4430 domain-containing protein [Streptococcus iniae]AGM99113.1 putative lipoprotein [Streptococcus iniae SF1]AHY16056.1 hypothetical protein DQ08_06240 [Streptococcus iniae]AHY17920.1 hypothetical protein DW64_06235 [Streptococcus iniae]APD32092.1 cobalamin ECF transporter [Streptococcus iniae]ASL35042.1 putative lipoprotein [Streptococcus iniae]